MSAPNSLPRAPCPWGRLHRSDLASLHEDTFLWGTGFDNGDRISEMDVPGWDELTATHANAHPFATDHTRLLPPPPRLPIPLAVVPYADHQTGAPTSNLALLTSVSETHSRIIGLAVDAMLAIDPAYRGFGLGAELMLLTCEWRGGPPAAVFGGVYTDDGYYAARRAYRSLLTTADRPPEPPSDAERTADCDAPAADAAPGRTAPDPTAQPQPNETAQSIAALAPSLSAIAGIYAQAAGSEYDTAYAQAMLALDALKGPAAETFSLNIAELAIAIMRLARITQRRETLSDWELNFALSLETDLQRGTRARQAARTTSHRALTPAQEDVVARIESQLQLQGSPIHLLPSLALAATVEWLRRHDTAGNFGTASDQEIITFLGDLPPEKTADIAREAHAELTAVIAKTRELARRRPTVDYHLLSDSEHAALLLQLPTDLRRIVFEAILSA